MNTQWSSLGQSTSKGRIRALSLSCLAIVCVSSVIGQPAQVVQLPAAAPDRILVRFSSQASEAARDQARGLIAGQRLRSYALVPGLELIRIPARAGGVEAALQALGRNPAVQYAEPDYVVQACVTPDDPYWDSLWGMANINAPDAWTVYTGDPNFVVAIIDTGMDYSHPDLAANVWTNPGETPGDGIDNDGNGYVDDVYGWDFAYDDNDPYDGNRHGTHTAGTVGACGNNALGVVGVNWQVKLMVLKFLDDSGSGWTSDAVAAVAYASAMGVKVSNNSWGGGGYSQSLYDAINAAKGVGHVFVAAAGNAGGNNDATPFYPASYALDNIIAVAAIDSADQKASWSCYGATTVDLGAPGVSILSTVPSDGYASLNGTSMATPHVAGAAALVYGLHPGWGYAQIRDQILGTARPITSLAGITVTGGTLDLAAAVSATLQPPAAPTDLAASAVSSTQIDLAWVDNSNSESGFTVWQSTTGMYGSWALLDTLSPNVDTYQDTGLSPNTTYYYMVQASNSAGASDSNVASATTLSGPTLHVSKIAMALSRAAKNTTATATVTIVDAGNKPLASATVTGDWYYNGPYQVTRSGVTGRKGTVSLKSNPVKATSGSIFTFKVTAVALAGYTYDSSGGPTEASITVP